MIDFKNEVAELLAGVIDDLSSEELYEMIEYPKYSNMGDFAFPCFRLAKVFRKAPNMIAEDLVSKIDKGEYFEKIEAVSGYVNFTVDKAVFSQSVIEEILDKKDMYGSSTIGNGQNIVVEYSSTNIAKPFHMGHIRSTMIGESLNRIYKFLGYNSTSVNHLGDYGTQFGKMIVAYLKWGDRELIEKDPVIELVKLYVKFHDEAKKNPELDDLAREWFTKLEDNDKQAVELWQWMKDLSLLEFDRVYKLLDVYFDSYAGESFYSDKIPAVLDEMRQKGIMEKDDGAEIVNLEKHGLTSNALITKKDGSSLYITRDLAAAIYRKSHYNFKKNIYVVGDAQELHFKQWMKIIELMGYDWAKDCVHVKFGLVSLPEGAMSTRDGRVVYLEDVLLKAVDSIRKVIEEKNPNLENKDEVARQVGVGAVVYQELSNNRIKDYVFSWEETLSFDGETGPYVMYTHARACSVLRKAGILGADLNIDSSLFKNVDYSYLADDSSKDVIRLLSKFPETIIDACEKYEPSMITRYITNLAQRFNRFYHDNPILIDDKEVRKTRLALVVAVKQTLQIGLYLIGLAAPEKM